MNNLIFLIFVLFYNFIFNLNNGKISYDLKNW